MIKPNPNTNPNWHPYEEDCPKCVPAILDMTTGKPFEMDSPEMVAVMKLWWQCTFEQREGFINVTCNNSRGTGDMQHAQHVTGQIERALKQVHGANE